MNYFEIINELRSKGINPYSGEFYDYSELPLADEFQKFHEFCQNHLERDDMPYNIIPARLYFSTNTTVNACAIKTKSYNLIEICKGSIFYLFNFFKQFESILNESQFELIKQLALEKNITTDILMFQLTTQYYFYHELAHLIQRQNSQIDYLENANEDCKLENIQERHVLEMDADCYSAYCMAMHLIQFAEKEGDEEGNPKSDHLLEIVAFSLAGLYLYYIDRSNKVPELYFMEHCHPHPSVRISYLIKTLLDNVAGNVVYAIPQQDILKRSIEIAISLNDKENIITNYSKSLYNNIDNIEGYIKVLIGYSSNIGCLVPTSH